MIDPASRARLEGWKLSLLGRRSEGDDDPLLSVAPSRQCIALVDVEPAELAASLANGGSIVLDSDRTDVPQGRIRVGRPPAELARDLVAIRRTARARFAQDGGHVLWLGLGTLVWCDRDGASHAAPLWLVPVELERVDGQLRVVAAGGVAACVNLALVAKLRRDFDLVLPVDVGSLAAIVELAEGIAVTRPGWRVEPTAHLGVFSLASAILWNDLDTLGDAVLASPLVAHLATGAERTFVQPSAAAAGAVTASTSPHDLLAPLDADATQLVAVAAAAAGATFALQGPPGTGKSQTIANLIVHAVSAGKTVLFVSGKRGALDAVQQRLAAIGLGEFCLDLGARRPRGAVVAQLGRILERAFRPGSNLGPDSRLADLRAALDAHVEALHRVGPFGHSLHEVLGRLVELRTTPRAWLADPDAVGLDAGKLARRKAAVAALAQTSIAVEPAASHPWRQSKLVAADDGLRARALAALDEAAAAGVALAASVRDVASLVPGLVARTRDQLVALGALAGIAAASPRPGAELLTNLRTGRRHESDVLNEQIALLRARGTGAIEPPRDPQAFLALATRHRELAREVDNWFTDAVDELDAHEAWSQLRKWTESVGPVRFVALRAVRTQVKAAAQPAELATDDAMISALEAVIAERACRAALLAAAAPAARWFGDLGGDPLALDLDRIEAAVGWASELRRAFESVDVVGGESGRASAWRALVAQVSAGSGDGSELSVFARLAETVARWEPALAVLSTVTGIDQRVLYRSLGAPDDRPELGSGEDHLAILREQIETLRHALDGLVPWVAFHAARTAAHIAGVGPAIAAIERGDIAAAELASSWERATLLAWVESELADHPVLAQFHGAQHHAHVAAFADFDRANLALERSRALARLAERVPRIGRDKSSRAPLPEELLAEIAILQAALRDPAREPSGPVDADATTRTSFANASLRELFGALPALLPRLAPCMLMTPQDVAQHLPPDPARFDIVVFDEAERLSTAAALGALARGASAVVVGDSQLLAEPSNLLDECTHARVPVLRLAWHYQSKHEELVAFANERYYDGRMQVFPAAAPSSELGVTWRRVEGTFERALGENRAEAEAIVGDVVARLREPAQRARSIGIVTFTEGQQALIEDLLDEARAADPSLEPFLAGGDVTRPAAISDPIVVKTADAMQGEVRDVIYVSIAGRPADDATPAELGPLWQPGGERRLAVAITRAREQLILVTSFGVEDVNVDAAPAGLVDLVALLAQTRTSGRPTERAEMLPASPITSAIARALADRGWTVRHQVGVGAYRIDLAVVDPNDHDRYVLAIEHDGAAYASAPTARDRDRIRPQILAQLGWRLHRIWSLDWWLDAEREIQRAHGAIVTAVAAGRQRRTTIDPAPPRTRAIRASNSPTQPSTPVIRIPPKRTPDSAPVLAAGSGPVVPTESPVSRPVSWSRLRRGEIPIGPYTVAAIPAGRRAPDDLFAPRHLPELGKVVEQVLAAEAPMHVELLARRVGAYFGIGRVTQRVTDQVKLALAGRAKFGDEDNVVWRLDQDPTAIPAVRVAPNDLGTSTWRDIGEVPLCELAAAVRIVVERAPNIGTTSLVRDTARLLGFTRVTERVTERIVVGVQSATERDLIAIENGRALLPS